MMSILLLFTERARAKEFLKINVILMLFDSVFASGEGKKPLARGGEGETLLLMSLRIELK